VNKDENKKIKCFVYIHLIGLLSMVKDLITVLIAVSAISILALGVTTNIFAQSSNTTGNSSTTTNTSSAYKAPSDGQGNNTLKAQSGKISGLLRGL
jgi:hypothetical protein